MELAAYPFTKDLSTQTSVARQKFDETIAGAVSFYENYYNL